MADAFDRVSEAMQLRPDFLCGHLWSVLPQFPNYLISDKGRVVSLIYKTPRLLSPIKMGEYVGLQLRASDGKTRKVYLHRLVAEAFHGPPDDNVECCRHLDGDRTNNDFANLAWGTHAENYADKVRHGRANFGERNPHAKLTTDEVKEMRQIRADTGMAYRRIAEQFGVTTMTAYRAITRQCWRDQ